MLYVVNLTHEPRSVLSALKRLEFEIASVRTAGGRLIQIEHGETGSIKTESRKMLRRYQKEGRISFFVCGEDFSSEAGLGKYICDKHDGEINEKEIQDMKNALTFVYL